MEQQQLFTPSRPATQNELVFRLMRDGQWRTLAEICDAINRRWGRRVSEAGVSARLRDQRKEGHTINRRVRRGSLWEYNMEVKRT